ncbi:MAG TPA: hypothetical protein VHK69_03410, partial [Chitinophagaceae bacterium]|nr:hypothetical protein [Chitinophagaceae bacterium]
MQHTIVFDVALVDGSGRIMDEEESIFQGLGKDGNVDQGFFRQTHPGRQPFDGLSGFVQIEPFGFKIRIGFGDQYFVPEGTQVKSGDRLP